MNCGWVLRSGDGSVLGLAEGQSILRCAVDGKKR